MGDYLYILLIGMLFLVAFECVRMSTNGKRLRRFKEFLMEIIDAQYDQAMQDVMLHGCVTNHTPSLDIVASFHEFDKSHPWDNNFERMIVYKTD